MQYSEKARQFLAAHGMQPERMPLAELVTAFVSEMERGLAGEKCSLDMIPTYLGSGVVEPGRRAAVIDAGGKDTFGELGDDWQSTVPAMLRELGALEPDQRAKITRALALLARTVMPDLELPQVPGLELPDLELPDFAALEHARMLPLGERMAQLMQEELSSCSGQQRKQKPGDYYILTRTTVPGILAECGFLSNAEERSMLQSADYQKKIATAIVQGLVRYVKET